MIAIPADRLVPGDIILIKEGDRIPADGRPLSVANLEVEESSLTGESSPVSKTVEPINTTDVALGDRSNMLFMNTNVTRGRGEMIVTATGMSTEVGGIAESLQETREIITPLTRQIDQLTVIVLIMGGVAFAGVLAGRLSRGQSTCRHHPQSSPACSLPGLHPGSRVDGGGASGIACRSPGPARSTREEAAHALCGIGSWGASVLRMADYVTGTGPRADRAARAC